MSAGFKRSLSLGFPSLLSPISDDSPIDDSEVDDAYLAEAVRRGADEIDLAKLQWKLQAKRRQRQSWRPATGAALLDTTEMWSVDPDLVRDANKYARERHLREHRALMEAEVDELGSFQIDFSKDFDEAVDLYSRIRAAMYCDGYNDPLNDVFKKLSKNETMLGMPVGGGLHEKFVERLSHLPEKLPPDLAAKVLSQIKKVYGFKPRNIAGSDSLSNHAYGLAIDIDEQLNPMFKNVAVIGALKKITLYDFGQPFFALCGLPKQRIQEIYKAQKDASDRLQKWLHRNLPAYEAQAKKKPSKSAEPLEPDLDLDSCEEIGENDRNLLDTLVGAYGPDEVRAWANHGIQSIPIELTLALVELGFGWGSEYQHSKDLMHFELEARKTIQPNVAKRRRLKDLFSSLEDPPVEEVRVKKKPAARKSHQG